MALDLYPIKGQYRPGEEIVLEARGTWLTGVLSVFHLQDRIFQMPVACTGETTRFSFMLPSIGGFGAALMVQDECGLADAAYTAFDIAVDGSIIRYGFLSDFAPGDDDDGDLTAMAMYHINAVQFYDWSFRHHELVPKSDEYMDMMGKHNSLSVIRRKINGCNERNMRALAYGAVYAAGKDFAGSHPDWALYAAPGKPLDFIGVFSIMDISPENPWRRHILGEYKKTMDLGFDGIHMDTYGFPKEALDSRGKPVYLEDSFPSLITETRAELSREGQKPVLIFNNVGGWPYEKTMDAPQDAVYIEVWPPFERYRDLMWLVNGACRAGKSIILAAYPAPFRLEGGGRALLSVRILMLAAGVMGAWALFLGEKNGALTQGYYADYAKLSEFQALMLRNDADFLVRYSEILYNRSLKDVSLTHLGGDNLEYACSLPCSPWGEPGKLWLIIRQDRTRKAIAIINLNGCADDLWNSGKDPIFPIENIAFTIQTELPVRSVWYTSPDTDHGNAVSLSFEQGFNGRSATIQVLVKRVELMGLLVIESQ